MSSTQLSFIDHLEELRHRILHSFVCVGLTSIVAFFFSEPILNSVIQKAHLQAAYFFSPIEAFTARIKVALLLGIAVSFPYLLYQTWAFIGPGLTPKERVHSISYIGTGLLLFVVGLIFGYFVLIPFGLTFLLSFSTEYVQPLMNISKYLTFIIWCLLGAGFLFQLPLLLFYLVKLGIVDIETVNKHRAEAIIAVLVLCAVITPTGDFFTLLLLSVPLILLLQCSIIAARISLRKQNK